MLPPETIDAAARASFEMHRMRVRYGPLDATLRAAPLDAAYRIQDALHRIMAKAGRGEIAGLTLVGPTTWNGGGVLGAPITEWRGCDVARAVTRCWGNDQPGGQGKTGDAMGHPFDAVAWLANLLHHRGRVLERGMVVMTGSSITTRFPAPGDRVRFVVEGLGEVALEVAR